MRCRGALVRGAVRCVLSWCALVARARRGRCDVVRCALSWRVGGAVRCVLSWCALVARARRGRCDVVRCAVVVRWCAARCAGGEGDGAGRCDVCWWRAVAVRGALVRGAKKSPAFAGLSRCRGAVAFNLCRCRLFHSDIFQHAPAAE